MKYRISRKANTDIEGICNRIALDDPEAADRMDERIHRAIELLAEVPGMGHQRADVSDERYLFWAIGNYIIAYRVEVDLIVVRVVHGAPRFPKAFLMRFEICSVGPMSHSCRMDDGPAIVGSPGRKAGMWFPISRSKS